MTSTLSDHGIRLRSAHSGNHKTLCPQCSHTRRKKRDPCLSVTIQPDGDAVWKCHNCGWAGSTKADTGGGERPYTPETSRVYRRPAAPDPVPDAGGEMYRWFEDRGISRATVDTFGCYLQLRRFGEENCVCITFPYRHGGEHLNAKYRTFDKRFQQEADAEPTLFGIDLVPDDAADLIFVEGECDVMACHEAGVRNVVSLPNGAPQPPRDGRPYQPEGDGKRYEPLNTHWEWLEKFERILIATDADVPGRLLAEELSRRLGRERCCEVLWPNLNDVQCKDANECLVEHGAAVLRECICGARALPIDGLYDPSVFFTQVIARYRGEGPQLATTGFALLDEFYRVDPGSFTVITGIPSHGKSNWLDQVAVQMAELHGWRWAVFSPEHSPARHLARLAEKRLRMPFSDSGFPRMGEGDLKEALAWIDRHFPMIECKDDTPDIDWVLSRAKAAVLRHGIRGLIIDPFNEVEASRPSWMSEMEFISQMISKVKRFAKGHDVAAFMVAHPTKMRKERDGKYEVPGLYDIAGAAHWRNKADAGICVYRDYTRSETQVWVQKVKEEPEWGRPGMVRFGYDLRDRSYRALGVGE